MYTQIETTIEVIDQMIEKFNNMYDKNVQIILKGSYVFAKEGLISRLPNDLNFCFTETKNESKKQFLNFIRQQESVKNLKEDGNILAFEINDIKIKLVTLERISEQFTKKSTYQNILLLGTEFAAVQRILMMQYVLSDWYQHDRTEKVKDIKLDLIEISDADPKIWEKINSKAAKDFLLSGAYNSFFIYRHYNYDSYLEYTFDLEKIEENLFGNTETRNIVLGKAFIYLKTINKIRGLRLIYKISDAILKSNHIIDMKIKEFSSLDRTFNYEDDVIDEASPRYHKIQLIKEDTGFLKYKNKSDNLFVCDIKRDNQLSKNNNKIMWNNFNQDYLKLSFGNLKSKSTSKIKKFGIEKYYDPMVAMLMTFADKYLENSKMNVFYLFDNENSFDDIAENYQLVFTPKIDEHNSWDKENIVIKMPKNIEDKDKQATISKFKALVRKFRLPVKFVYLNDVEEKDINKIDLIVPVQRKDFSVLTRNLYYLLFLIEIINEKGI
ncbi:hypothetical protein DA803_03130 [[Mycoplasma] phocae]|uniref:Uncharacterized protein n=1 Tax=[Mycoplasma] phocae TaxID=142651 RepID=A0A2Z5IQY0_9BACT|nr:hypothetical protein [[Mycoplasma] phocae]AXE61062.1 hypothetical protein DA803_03130 [[Mycoplasma] phocae]